MEAEPVQESKYTVPKLTFGLELGEYYRKDVEMCDAVHPLNIKSELCFIVKRRLYFEWLGVADPKSLPAETGRQRSERRRNTRIEQTERILELGIKASLGRKPEQQWNYDIIPQDRDSGSTASHATTLQSALLGYMCAFFNHQLPTSPEAPSLLGTVIATDPKEGKHDSGSWHLEFDESVKPHRHDYATLQKVELEDIKKDFHVGGAEVVSPILSFWDDKWLPMVQQIYKDFKFDNDHGIWLNGDEGLHVHFGAEGGLDFRTIQNLIALYGLFEKQIERWIDKSRRSLDGHTKPRDRKREGMGTEYCDSIRCGMEKKTHGNIYTSGHRYTPQEFTERVYACKNEEELCGEVGDLTKEDALQQDMLFAPEAKYVTVYISLAREGKALTLEFRHHKATTDPIVIMWWVKFCGFMLKHASLMTQIGTRLLDEPNCETSFLDELLKKNILDLIVFPDDGKEHFKKRAREENDDCWNDGVKLEERVIKERIRLRKLGNSADLGWENRIRKEQWFIGANNDLLSRYNYRLQTAEELKE